MRINQSTALQGGKVTLVPYGPAHVARYAALAPLLCAVGFASALRGDVGPLRVRMSAR